MNCNRKRPWLKAISLVGFLFMANSLLSQQEYIDSLKQVALNQPESRAKADNLLLLSKKYYRTNMDSGWHYVEEAYRIARLVKYPELESDALNLMGIMKRINGRYEESLFYSKKCVHVADSIGDTAMIAKGNINLGVIYSDLMDFQSAVECHRVSLLHYLAMNNTNGIVANYNNMALSFMRLSAYDSAAFYFIKALNIYEKEGQEAYLSAILLNLGELYHIMGQYEKAHDYAIKAIEIYKRNDNKQGLAKSYNRLGNISADQRNYTDAMDNYILAESYFKQSNDTLEGLNVVNNIGNLYKEQGENAKAIQFFQKALAGYKERGEIRGSIIAMGNIATIYYIQGRYKEALALNETVLNLTVQYDSKEYRADALYNISGNYAMLGNYKEAFDYQSRYFALKDSIFNLDKEKIVNDLSLKYEKEKDHTQILSLEKSNLEKDLRLKQQTLQRNTFLYAGLSLLALAVFLFLYINQRRKKDGIIARQKIRQLEEEKKLMAAKLLIEGQEIERKRISSELHDGLGVILSATKMQFSTLVDNSPANRELIEKASRMLEQASGDVRKISHNMMPGLLTKLGFYEAVEDLIDQINETGGLSSVCDILGHPVRMSENKEIMLYRIIQELVNNTLKHAQAKNIKLQVQVIPGLLDIVYTDDGTGFNYEQKLESGTIGLKSIQSRLDFLDGKMSVESDPGKGVKFSFQIPA